MDTFITVIIIVIAAGILYRVIRYIRKERYFNSEEFLAHKARLASVVVEHNEVARYASEIRHAGSFWIGGSTSGSQAHLASSHNTSHYRYRRDRNVPSYGAPNVHNCSLQITKMAEAEPIKYIMKYFNIRATEATLDNVERLGEDISRL